MSKFLDSNGLRYLWGKVKAYVDASAGGGTAGSVAWENVTGKPELALKSELSSVYRFKGREYCGRCVERGGHRHELRLDRDGVGRLGGELPD